MSSNLNPANRTYSPEEKFELLSAYMDNEVTKDDKRLVEQWLATDTQLRRSYQQLLRVRQLFIDLPVPDQSPVGAKSSTDLLVDRVMGEIDRRSQRRKLAWGGIGLVAAASVAAVSSLFTLSSSPQFSPVSNQLPPKEEPLILAMEKPIVPIPKSMSGKQP